MATKEQLRIAAAVREVRRASADIIRRGGDPELVAAEVHQAYTGRGWQPPPAAGNAETCSEHPSIRPPCPICV